MDNLQPDLFTGVSSTPLNPPPVSREKARKRAFEKADKFVMDGYRHLLTNVVGRVKPTFGAWDVTQMWEKQHGKLSETNRKALGQLYADLMHSGVIRENGTGRRPNGNIAVVYSLNR